MTGPDAPFHAHIYFLDAERPAAQALHRAFAADRAPAGPILFIGPMAAGSVGPHPIPQFEVHFLERSLAAVRARIAATGLTTLIHPLTHDDLADHTTLAQWLGEPLALDLSVLDPPGRNQGVARFGVADF